MRLQVHGTRGSAVIHDDQLEYFHAGDRRTVDPGGRRPGEPDNQAADGRRAGRAARRAEGRPDAVRRRPLAPVRRHRGRDRRPAGRPAVAVATRPCWRIAVVRAIYVSAHAGPAGRRWPTCSAGELRRRPGQHRGVGHVKFSVFTASTPEWTPAEAARILAAQGWDGIEWRVTDQDDAPQPGFWAGNRATWPLTGLEERLPDDRRGSPATPGWSSPALGGYAARRPRPMWSGCWPPPPRSGAGRVRVTMPTAGRGNYRDLFDGDPARPRLGGRPGRRARRDGAGRAAPPHHRRVGVGRDAAGRRARPGPRRRHPRHRQPGHRGATRTPRSAFRDARRRTWPTST